MQKVNETAETQDYIQFLSSKKKYQKKNSSKIIWKPSNLKFQAQNPERKNFPIRNPLLPIKKIKKSILFAINI